MKIKEQKNYEHNLQNVHKLFRIIKQKRPYVKQYSSI